MGQDLLRRNARRDIDMLEQGNADRHQEGSGVRPLIALLVASLIAVSCGSNVTDEQSVEDHSDAGATEADVQPDPGLATESPAAEEAAAAEAAAEACKCQQAFTGDTQPVKVHASLLHE